MNDSQWHILRVTSGSETKVAAECGYPAYVPRQRVHYFNRRLRKNVVYYKPLLNGFVFVNVAEPADFRAPPSKDRIGFLRNGDRSPARLSPAAFRLLRATEAQFCTKETTLPEQAPVKTHTHKVGDKVSLTVSDHPVLALINEIKGDKLLTEVIGSKLRLTLNTGDVVAA